MATAQQPPTPINLDSKLGAAFLGDLIAAVFYGITCVQTFIYYKKNYKDTTPFKFLIFGLWILDTVHLAFITHALYYYLVSNFGNFANMAFTNWSILAQVYLTCISDLLIRSVFARRVWLMTKRYRVIAIALLGSIAATSILTFVTGFAFASRAYQEKTFENFSKISYFLYTALGSGVLSDILIATSLCIALSRSRTGFRKTNSLVNILMAYTINTSLLTTVCATACFITYTIWPHEFTFIGIYFSLSKLYLNSLLATLNGRDALMEKVSGVSDIVLSSLSSRPAAFTPKDASVANSRPQHVLVSIDREVEVDGSKVGYTA